MKILEIFGISNSFHRNGFLFTQVSSFQKLLTIAGSDFHRVLEDFIFSWIFTFTAEDTLIG